MTRDTIDRYASIEDLLGPAAGRFFGLGYRLTDPRLRRVEVGGDSAIRTLTAEADAISGDIWSHKGGAEQRPHLSTTDLVVLGIAAAHAVLAHDTDPADLISCSISRIDIRAPRRPIEGDLTSLPVRARSIVDASPGDRATTTVVEIDIASFGLVVDVRMPPARAEPPHHLARSQDERPADGVYCSVYRSRSPHVRDIILDVESARASLSVPESGRRPASELRGFEADHQPAINLVDALVATLQLGQVLLYRLDGLDRAESDTLWMRSTRITASPTRSWGTRSSLETHLDRPRLLLLKGESWRLADIVGKTDSGLQLSCSVAHRLVVS
ncbi:hypothetical protein ACVLV4_002956 [Rathayibacter agropyri]